MKITQIKTKAIPAELAMTCKKPSTVTEFGTDPKAGRRVGKKGGLQVCPDWRLLA